MRFWMILALLSLLVLPGRVMAQQGIVVDRISSLRLNIERIEDAESAVRLHRDKVAKEHEALAVQIKEIKESMGDSVLPNFPLEAKLRKSHDLANTLTLLNRELDALERARKSKLEKLEKVYDELVEQTAKIVRTASEGKKQQLVRFLARARSERQAVRAQLSSLDDSSFRTSHGLNEKDLLASDDPDELSERADAVRDEQDKLRKELAFVDKRIKELADEARLDREMREFVGDHDIFNEDSRVVVAPSVQNDTPENDKDLDYGQIGNGRNDDPSSLSGQETSDPVSDQDAGKMVDDSEGPDALFSGGPRESSSKASQLQKRKRWIIQRLKKLQNIHDRILERMDEMEKE